MINIEKCKDTAKALAEQVKEELDTQKLERFSSEFDTITEEYYKKYMLHSTAIELQRLKSFNEWLPNVAEDKILLTPIIVDKMVNEKDLYSLSLYQNLYVGTEFALHRDNCRSSDNETCLGENELALMTGCHWVEQISATE